MNPLELFQDFSERLNDDRHQVIGMTRKSGRMLVSSCGNVEKARLFQPIRDPSWGPDPYGAGGNDEDADLARHCWALCRTRLAARGFGRTVRARIRAAQ